MDLGLEGRSALIAGGSTGIGRAIAVELARAGTSVTIAARRREPLEQAAAAIADVGPAPQVLEADLCDTEQVERTVARTREHHGGLDILINNVGDSVMGHDWRTNDADWAAMIETSLLSAVRCSRAAVPHLLESPHARIITIASVNGHQPPAGRGDYNAAKAAVLAFSKTLSHELAPRVTVNAICPARIDTPLWRRMAATMVDDDAPTVDAVLGRVAARDVPLGRFGRPEDVAGLTAFLASARASWITGVAYNVDGGYTKAST